MKKISPLIFILSFSSLFSQSEQNILELNDTWFASHTEENGKPVIVRGREFLSNFIQTQKYNVRIEVVWNLESPTDFGLPTPEQNEVMGSVEDALVEIMESDLQSVLTIVYTHDKIRSWIFYTTNLDEFLKRLNRALSKFKRLPLSITHSADKEWNMYLDFLSVYNLK